jgi:hypothetical protein
MAFNDIDEMKSPEVLDDQDIEQVSGEQEIAELDAADLAQEAAIKQGYFDGPIPADITAPPGLSPKRADLARFLEWRRRTADEIGHLEEAIIVRSKHSAANAPLRRRSTRCSKPTLRRC